MENIEDSNKKKQVLFLKSSFNLCKQMCKIYVINNIPMYAYT